MPSLAADLEKTTGDRYRCPICDARRGLSVDEDEGQTGVWHCFACQRGGTGAELYAEVHGLDIAEALDVFGVSGSDMATEIKRKEEQAPKPREHNLSDAEMAERYRAWMQSTDGELTLRAKYKHRRVAASERRDREAWERWNRKLKTLRQHVLKRTQKEHRETDRFDANIPRSQ